MVYQVVWPPLARKDLRRIANYIAEDSPFYAETVVNKIVDVSDTLAQYPKRGRVVPEWGMPDIRERFVYSYRLIYQISGNEVGIVAVIHSRRQLEVIEDRVSE